MGNGTGHHLTGGANAESRIAYTKKTKARLSAIYLEVEIQWGTSGKNNNSEHTVGSVDRPMKSVQVEEFPE